MINDLSVPLRLPVRHTQTGSGAQAGQIRITNGLPVSLQACTGSWAGIVLTGMLSPGLMR